MSNASEAEPSRRSSCRSDDRPPTRKRQRRGRRFRHSCSSDQGLISSYLDITSFSKSGLVHQLEFDGFTHSQAVYGVNKAYH
jgi:hypothetical protein